MREAGYRPEFWTLDGSEVVVDQQINLGLATDILLKTPEEITTTVEAYYKDQRQKKAQLALQ